VGGSRLQDQLLAPLLPLGVEGGLELLQATRPQGAVGRPVRLVERPAGGGDGPPHVGRRRVGDAAEHLLGRRVDVLERLAGIGIDELAVDEHPRLRADLRCVGHSAPPSVPGG
jgi:hypothetical protein